MMTKNELTKESLEKCLYVDKMSKAEIARLFDVTKTTILRQMKKFGLVNETHRSVKKTVVNLSDLKNKKFGRLTVMELSTPDKHGKAKWRCVCECGNVTEINASSLIRNLTRSCGCLKRDLNHKGYKDISSAYWKRTVKGAKSRGLEFEIDQEYVWDIYEQQGGKCAMTDLPIKFHQNSNRPQDQTASIDRIDSGKGYIKGNIQIVHKGVNLIKSFLSCEEFVALCTLVTNKLGKSQEGDLTVSFTRTVFRKKRFKSSS